MNVTGHTSQPPVPPAEPGTARQQRPVSIRDVAAAASVSYQTVSRVINNHPSVKESTRAAVLAAIMPPFPCITRSSLLSPALRRFCERRPR